MRKLFIDTGALVALFDEDDHNHMMSIVLFEDIKKQRIRIVLTDYILDECITTVLARAGHRSAVAAGGFMLSSKILELVWLDESIKLKAWEYFKKHSDKHYSFTDCTSFVLMKEMKLTHYFAFDDDFNKAGFIDFSG
jgi:predicted nucleic acid-binding protein